ncbi:MAG TPA: choice-of-anchor Q domain-containing protein, partial [Candidatus Nitrosocosmicus sp.]|nr:choice-of-anchor Q domain-containing protein [Candidatus Nitrosocosmicus sp.]
MFALINTDKTLAATFLVTKTSDTNDGVCNSDCSLREAIAAANVATSDDLINFDTTLFATAQTITLTSGELAISNSGNLTINGTGADLLSISGNNASRVFLINSGANVILNGITITSGNVGIGDGGGILAGGQLISTLTINNSRIINNSAGGNTTGGSGGGIFVTGFANLIINNSVISNNFAGSSAGGIFSALGTLTINNSTISNNTARFDAGGIITSRSSFGTGTTANPATITNSTISDNRTMFQHGGGLYNRGSITIVNSTISNNSAREDGGGIYNNNLGTLALISSTIANNQAGINSTFRTGGGINSSNFSINSITARNTIIANNTSGGEPHDFRGNLTSQGHNLIETTIDVSFRGDLTGNITGQDPLLDPVLRNNGGQTQTHALLQGSPAINAGNNANAPAIDQRGLPRIVGGTIDIGAYEEQAISFCTFTLSQSLVVVPGRGGNVSFNVSAPAGCPWTAIASPWITITSGARGDGNGTVSFSVQLNQGDAAREGYIVVAGQTVTVYQSI